MMGQTVTLKDIELGEPLEDLVMPAHLLCEEESLSSDDTPEEESLSPYQVDTICNSCNKRIRLCVLATTGAIHLLEQLLFHDLSLVCPHCSRDILRHGRTH
ncbi:E7 [Human papillomavirus 154]|uniref:Protein E7 n=1 Tax=Human papillomavirus 154 TaxID=1195796 RepID=R9QBU2_9PAPI|nr:E7 [Human papillomavirus 154]AFL02847.1 E7 [Human papillomavirus 154]